MEFETVRRRIPRLAPALWLAAVLFACEPPAETAETVQAPVLTPVNGTELFVTRLGEGEPIIVVHGGPMLEHGYLLPHLEPVAETHELILYDQRLSGRSAPEVDSASVRLQTYVDDIEALRTTLGLKRIHLMGHSWGGLLAMNYAIRYGENLKSLILLSPMSPSTALWQQEEKALAELVTDADRAEMQTIRQTEAFAQRRPEAIAELLRTSFKAQFHDRSLINELRIYVPDDYASRSAQFGYMTADLTDFDLQDALAGVDVPTLIIYGAAEPSAEIGGPVLDELLPNSELVVIENSGHFPFIEQPDTLLATVLDFLDRND
ncbi:MAG: prolyl aminopeptidase [Gemmatimonadota bacterium]|nr:MAG: prolyl aminopeptidase [Gemmatimonadota bacterium]